MIDLKFLFQYLEGRCYGNQIICERQVQHGQKTGVFCQIFPDILDLFSQTFHHERALFVPMIGLKFIFQYLEGRCHGNKIIYERQVQHSQKNWRILLNISRYTAPIFAIFSPYESSLCTDDGAVLFFQIWSTSVQ